MSQGLQLLSAACAAGSNSAMRMMRPELFTEDERPAYDFVANFYRQHGRPPNAEACNENGFRLLPVSNPVSYYFERVRQRNVGAGWMKDHPEFVKNMGRANVEGAQAILERMVRTGRSFDQQQATVVSLDDAAEMVLEDYLQAKAQEGLLRGITFGWDYLDAVTGGATEGDVTVFAARPNVGKSWTMLYNALSAWRAGHSVLFVTMEMTVLQTARRLIGMMTGINPKGIKSGRLGMWAEPVFYERIEDGIGGAPFHFVAGDLKRSVSDVAGFIREFTPDLVIVDAAYLLDAENKGGKFAKHEVLADVLKGIKEVAMSCNVPINISVQLNREATKGKAGLEHLAGSDWIGQIASNVILISPADEPFHKVQRLYEITKSRDGEVGGKFVTAFLFAPFDMGFIREVREEEDQQRAEMAALNQGMI